MESKTISSLKEKVKSWIDTAIEVTCELSGKKPECSMIQITMPSDIAFKINDLGLFQMTNSGTFVYPYQKNDHVFSIVRIQTTETESRIFVIKFIE